MTASKPSNFFDGKTRRIYLPNFVSDQYYTLDDEFMKKYFSIGKQTYDQSFVAQFKYSEI